MHRCTFLGRSLGLLLLLSLCGSAAQAIELTKDEVEFRKKLFVNKKGERQPYRLYVPVGYDKSKTYPLVIWLHGGEGRGSDNKAQIERNNTLGSHFWIREENQSAFRTFVFAPQCPEEDNWAEPELNTPSKALLLTLDALAAVEKEYSIDPDRIYLAGQSMGGLGVWSLLQMYPEKWAAAIILSAYDNFTNPVVLSKVPIWVFQGDADQTVPVDLVREMMKQLKKLHANVRYTEYHKANHEVWNKAFAEPELIPWLSGQRRGLPAQAGQPAKGQLGTGAGPANH